MDVKVQEEAKGLCNHLRSEGYTLYSYPNELFPVLIMFHCAFKKFKLILFKGEGDYEEKELWLHAAESKASYDDQSKGNYTVTVDDAIRWWVTFDSDEVNNEQDAATL